MKLEIALYLSLVFHLMGDYLFQNDWMARWKTKEIGVAALHAFIYSLPFLYILPSGMTSFISAHIIFFSHMLIDRYRLAEYWIKLVNWNWNSTNHGYDSEKPKWMSVWLMIIIDNSMHVIINTACIFWAYGT